MLFSVLLTFVVDYLQSLYDAILLYNHRGNKKTTNAWLCYLISVYAAVYIIFIDVFYGVLQFATLFSLPLLMRYDGTRGVSILILNGSSHYYPTHLAIIGILESFYMEIFHWYFKIYNIWERSTFKRCL